MANTARRSHAYIGSPNLHIFTWDAKDQVDRDLIEPFGRDIDRISKLIAGMIATERLQFGRIKRLATKTNAVDALIAKKLTQSRIDVLRVRFDTPLSIVGLSQTTVPSVRVEAAWAFPHQ